MSTSMNLVNRIGFCCGDTARKKITNAIINSSTGDISEVYKFLNKYVLVSADRILNDSNSESIYKPANDHLSRMYFKSYDSSAEIIIWIDGTYPAIRHMFGDKSHLIHIRFNINQIMFIDQDPHESEEY